MNNKISQKCDRLLHGSILTLLNIPVQIGRNPLRVCEGIQESLPRISEIVPAHPDRLPGAERITPIIYVLGGQAESELSRNRYFSQVHQCTYRKSQESKSSPLRKIVPLAQGIAFFKKRGLQ